VPPLQNAAALHIRYETVMMKRISLLFIAFALGTGFACAQNLQQLTIPMLTLAADKTHVPVGQPFHLTVHAHITQNITHLDNLTLPSLSDFDEVSREAHLVPAAGGSDYDEVLTLKPKHEGDIEIAPVTIDAINAETMKPSRFSSTEQVVIHAGADPANKDSLTPQVLERYAAIGVISFFIAYLTFRIGGTLFDWAVDAYKAWRTRPAPTPPSNVIPTSLQLASMSAVERFRLAITTLQRDPSESSAEALRTALRDALGATEEETMADILARMPESERSILGRALRAAERAAFIDTSLRRSAIDDGLPIFEIACQRLEK